MCYTLPIPNIQQRRVSNSLSLPPSISLPQNNQILCVFLSLSLSLPLSVTPIQNLGQVTTQLEESKEENLRHQADLREVLVTQGECDKCRCQAKELRQPDNEVGLMNSGSGVDEEDDEDGGTGRSVGRGEEMYRLQGLLERTERELFETRTLLEAKVL